MDGSGAPAGTYDPARHESQILALFDDRAAADHAKAALFGVGVPAEAIDILSDAASSHRVQSLFIPEQDYQDYQHALGRGQALLVVRPRNAAERDASVATVEACAPLDVETHGRRWRGTPEAVDRLELNHANVSRADMRGRALQGRDEVVLDMTGQKMVIRVMSEQDMAEAPYRPMLLPQNRPAPLASPIPAQAVPITGVTYTHGVPADVVERMTPEEQVMAQTPATDGATRHFIRVVGNERRVGWRDRPPQANRVRSYVTERGDTQPS